MRPLFAPKHSMLSTALLAFTLPVAGNVLRTDAILRVKGDSWEGTRVTVLPEFGEPYDVPLNSHRFDLEFGLQAVYVLRAEHAGCPTKEVVFDCRVPMAYASIEFDFPFEIILEKLRPSQEPFTYANPVGAVFFESAKEDFGYTTDYSRIMEAPVIPELIQRLERFIQAQPAPLASPVSVSLSDQLRLAAEANGSERPSRIGEAPVEGDHMEDHSKAAGRDASAMTAPEYTTTVLLTKETEDDVSVTASDIASERRSLPPKVTVVVNARRNPSSRDSVVLQRSVPIAERNEVMNDPQGPCGSHDLLSSARCIIRIDRVPTSDGCTELRKVTHAWGGVFYFQDGRSATEAVYLRELQGNLPSTETRSLVAEREAQ
ncbi:MAG: hypothetical protein H6591_10040 [Flavobacteriales bacterium]|nr:hypothetical protein [Flavobacteriales bacterium]